MKDWLPWSGIDLGGFNLLVEVVDDALHLLVEHQFVLEKIRPLQCLECVADAPIGMLAYVRWNLSR